MNKYIHQKLKAFIQIGIIVALINNNISYAQLFKIKDTLSTKPDSIINSNIKLPLSDSYNDTSNLSKDTTSNFAADSLSIDSIQVRFISGMGKIGTHYETTSALYFSNFLWSDAKYFGELIWMLPGFYYRDLGEAGKWGELNALGLDGRSISILMDGRKINDPVSGIYNLYDLPLEFCDQLELYTGTSAIGTSNNSCLTMNFITHFYNNYRPITKIRFVQDPAGTLLTDGLFAQNIARGLNLMLGFTRQTTEGRYLNAELDAWNIRTRLRYNISNKLNISLTDFYTKARNHYNGGVDNSITTDIFEEQNAFVINTYSLDQRMRRDITFSSIANIISNLSPTYFTAYYSILEREYWDSGSFNKINDSTKAFFWGFRLQQVLSLHPIYTNFGAQYELTEVCSTRTLPFHLQAEKSLFASLEARLIDVFIPSISLRSNSLDDFRTLDFALKISSRIADRLSIFADASWYDRFPTIQERFWTDSTLIRNSNILKEQHIFSQAGLKIDINGYLKLDLSMYERKSKNPIIYKSSETLNGNPAIEITNIKRSISQGVAGKLVLNLYEFEIQSNISLIRYKEQDTLKLLIPETILGSELSYRNKFFKDKLDAKFGVRWQFYNRQISKIFDSQTLSYFQESLYMLGRANIIDLFTILNIGSAYISLSWNNILGTKYMQSPVYPMPGRYFRIGVNWTFID